MHKQYHPCVLVKCVVCSREQPYWFWLTETVGLFYLSLTCEMFTLVRKYVTFCSAQCSLSYTEKTRNSMLFLLSLTQRFPNCGKDSCQPSLCLLEHLHFYCSTLNREFLRILGSPDQLQTFITSPAIHGSRVGSAVLAKKVPIFIIFSLIF